MRRWAGPVGPAQPSQALTGYMRSTEMLTSTRLSFAIAWSYSSQFGWGPLASW